MLQIYRRNAQVSIAVILVVSPSPQKIAPQIRLSFHTRISTPICHACIEATYLYTSLRIVIMETNALHQNQNYHSIGMIDFSKGQLVSTRRLVIENTFFFYSPFHRIEFHSPPVLNHHRLFL